jgi:heme-degrading monooxygenase HmoA
MSNPAPSSQVARLWEHPQLCVALFGIQLRTDDANARYHASGIGAEMMQALEVAHEHGLLHSRFLMSEAGPVIMQYWRSHDDLNRWSRQQPHARWWQWLRQNTDADLGVYHEIYQARTAEAIFFNCHPVGPATFCTLETATHDGRSSERQTQFERAQDAAMAREGDAA